MVNFKEVWYSYTGVEKRNIAFYIGGIMMYKLGLEFFNGSITTLATDRFKAAQTFTKLAAASGVNQAAQCVGAILIAPLIQKWPTRTILAFAVIVFSLMTTILLIVDASTGGTIKKVGGKVDYGDWNPNLIFVVWTLSGIAYGMVELIRRVIPADIVGGNVSKLRRMDATVHVFYEIAGTAGAFASSSAISRFGNNYSFFLTPVFFTLAGGIWLWVTRLSFDQRSENIKVALEEVEGRQRSGNYLMQVWYGAVNFVQSIWLGMKIVFGHRRFIWLFPAYTIALYLHRALENTLAPAFARVVLGTSAWSQIIVGGSNFGELLGALSVFVLSDYVPTPIPWLRFDALMLNLVWILPTFAKMATHDVSWAWKIAGCFIPISMGWAAGDVSLAAYIQSALTSGEELGTPNISALGAVMAFLYSSYIIIFAFVNSLLGKVIDKDNVAHKNIIFALKTVGGAQFSVGCVIILLGTLIPRGAFSLNPKVIEQPLEGANRDSIVSTDGLDQEKGEKNASDTESEDVKPATTAAVAH